MDNVGSTNSNNENIDPKKFLLDRENAQKKTFVRDPLFAAKVLEEQKPIAKEVHGVETADQIRRVPSKETGIKQKRPSETTDSVAVENIKQKSKVLRQIRTYKSDVAKALKQEKTSVVGMVLAEQKRKSGNKETSSPKSKKNKFFVAGSILLGIFSIMVILGGVWYFFTKNSDTNQPTYIPTSIIFTETRKEIDVTGKSKDVIYALSQKEVRELDIRLDFIERVYFTKTISAPEKESSLIEKVTAQELFLLLESRIPDVLLRSLRNDFVFGIHSFNGNQPFLILQTDFFENAFAGMLKWETFLAREIAPLFNETLSGELKEKEFLDVVIKNRDLRVLYDEEGKTVLLYSFVDRETIVIATATETLDEVITRLNREK